MTDSPSSDGSRQGSGVYTVSQFLFRESIPPSKMADIAPWGEPQTATKGKLVQLDSATFRSLSPAEQKDDRRSREKAERRWNLKMADKETDHDYTEAEPEDKYDGRDGPSSFSLLFGKSDKAAGPKKPKKSMFSRLRNEKRDEKGGEWKKIP